MRLLKWCPGADLNHRHADFQALENHSENKAVSCKPTRSAAQLNQPLSPIGANRFERINGHVFHVQTFQNALSPCIAIPVGKRRCSDCLVNTKCELNLPDLAQTLAGLKNAEVSQ